MRIESLRLRNFRNIEESTLFADPHLNFLIGSNGQGKTSFLEALGYLATLRSFRGSKTEEVISWGKQAADVSCLITSDEPPGEESWKTELKVCFTSIPDHAGGTKRTSKTALINGKLFQSSTQYLSQRFGSYELGFHTVVFNPSDHDLVRGDPSIRRSYLDRVIAAEDPEYLHAFMKYQRVLKQRNALLRSLETPSSELLLGFSEPLGRYGAFVTWKRLQWIQSVADWLNLIAQQIAPGQPELKLIYLSNWVPEIENLSIKNEGLSSVHFTRQESLPSLEHLEQAFWKRLSVLEQAEWKARSSLVGPHRDDWTFFLGGQVLKGHGSQGEVRSALLALKLSEIELFRKRTGHRPLLLLDDFSSELDQKRRAFLLRFLLETDLQVFVTTTDDLSSFGLDQGKRFKVVEGRLFEISEDEERPTARAEENRQW